ncbi:transcriptional regulator, AraC family [Ralstonia pickettii OR214]|jgi:AraC-like DNA-binding protein|uniref:Transcriptional regulator, AraC family n=1 Tax=Ralstonia pickettii OR214 TaxID=1264675 RepID=R0CRM4_RALPI|nr:transcriptional regulator, AraC family [Ralstonia pickettii OR214]MBL4778694.1 helix-turn-helix domain-containing protein [Ralstonia sp.]OYU22921.1 MAG: AraC family transcriptional regulator [Ralstonia sp. PBBBR1]
MDIRANLTQPSTLGNSVRAVIDAMFVDECYEDGPRIVIPRPELHLAVRLGSSISGGVDIHVLGARQRVTRKIVRGGQWTILARLQLVHARAVLGASPSAFRGYVVPVDQVWGAADAQSLYDDLLTATSPADAAVILERVIAGRLSPDNLYQGHSALVFEAAKRMLKANVGVVASDLGISERHLRRVFLETVGIGPKTFVRLMRFSRATDLARENHHASWASIAVAVGYYDQAHLIEDFHFFAGTTPEAFRRELGNTGVLKSIDRAAACNFI